MSCIRIKGRAQFDSIGYLTPGLGVTVQVVGRASRLSWGRLALGRTSAGKRPGPAGETPAPLPEQLRFLHEQSPLRPGSAPASRARAPPLSFRTGTGVSQ